MKPIPTHGLFQNLIGEKFSRLSVTGYEGRIGANNNWLCECDCGNKCVIAGGNLKSGHTQSCGCLHKEETSKAAKTHGASNSEEYKTFYAMKNRCYDKSVRNYVRYGGRGIKVCDRWLNSFELFLLDMGEKPSPEYSIDRINNDGNYEPENCRWATKKEQANNKSTNRLITINGITKNIKQWSEETGLHYSAIIERSNKGLTGLSLIAPSVKYEKLITFQGITDNYAGWSKRTGISEDTISQRIRRNGWDIARTLTTGVSP